MYKLTRTQPPNASAQKASKSLAAPQTRRPPAPPAPAARPVPKVLQTKQAGSMSPQKPRAENRPKPQAVQQPRPPAKVLQPKTRATALPVNRQHAAPPVPSAQRTRPAPLTLQTKSAARPEAFKRQPPFAHAASKVKPDAAPGRPPARHVAASVTAANSGTLQRKASVVVPIRPRFELKRPAVVIPSASGVVQRAAAAAAVKAPAKAPGLKYRAISLANLKAYIADDDYYVNAMQQYYEVHGKKREYGVKIKIIKKDKSADSIMTWAHFHYTAGGAVDSGHFKNGGSKHANQGFDMGAGEAATLINALLAAGVSAGTWTSIKDIYTPAAT